MQNASYPNIYEAKFQTGYHGNEPTRNGVYITKCLLREVIKNVRPRYDSNSETFYSSEDYRIRIEVNETSGNQYYVLDVGQNYGHIEAADFMSQCREAGSVSPDVVYCDNIPCAVATTEESGIEQRTGTIKAYVSEDYGCGADTGKRIAGNIALAYIKAVNDLSEHFMVTDSEAFRLL
ncbi:MAG: hypothetical protein IKE05_00955 [Clostridia bacterium]|nr:hypothetical protein [Clostridia bacterium]